MKCVSCNGTTEEHNTTCPLHPDERKARDQRLLAGPDIKLALEVRRVRALEDIA